MHDGHSKTLLLLLLLFAATIVHADDQPAAPQLVDVVRDAVLRGEALGAQVAIVDRSRQVGSWSFGVRGVGNGRGVDNDTLFCIGSCSKPFASTCVLALIDDGKLELDRPIDAYLAEFKSLALADGAVADRAPTMRELLAHRGGIYSQKIGMTRQQTRAIRDFSLSLEEALAIIARQPLISPPGEQFAYSDAGYCIVGRVAEAASKQSFEQILQQRICQPLKLERTTYFPDRTDTNIALGAIRENGEPAAHPQTPHAQGDRHRLPLIGGSIYSTATETARFAQAMLNAGRTGNGRLVSKEGWGEITRQQFAEQPYGLGWLLKFDDDRASSLSHSGALAGNRSLLYIDLARGRAVAIHWTLTDATRNDRTQAMQQRLRAAVDGGEW